MRATRVVHSVHGVITPRRIEDPPDVIYVAVALPSENGGVPRGMNDRDSGLSLSVEGFVRTKSLPLKLQEDISSALEKRHREGGDSMQLCGETIGEIGEAMDRVVASEWSGS